ncbi:hypothetical protein RvY_15680 [Ramazzottius varieornatus]|uniref:Uncharacterized protein n=1 Tax=Ramazzottius varieornatus TaxID=947166 RepID=A0A1D1VVT3_RAMVA|nr:hypothetical protein RvY_15680 [Ramazzottius varieornatus]
MRMHVKTTFHKSSVQKRAMVLHERPENMPAKTRINKLRRLWFSSLAAASVPILASDKFRHFLRTFVEGGAAIPQRPRSPPSGPESGHPCPPNDCCSSLSFATSTSRRKRQHVVCHPCNKNVITLGTKQTVFDSDLERQRRTKKHGKRTSQHTLLKPHYHASSSGITKQKDWNIKSVICPACNKPVTAFTCSMRMHVKTTFHKSSVQKRAMVLHERPENMPAKTRINKLRRLWFSSLAAASVPILASDKFRHFLRTFVEGGAAIPQR